MARGALRFLLAFSLPLAAGHGYLFEPPARNNFSTDDGRQAKSGYCPQCGNGQGICGDGNQWPLSADYVSFVQEPSRTYTAGEVVEFAVIVTAAHLGHYEFFLCDRAISADNASALACLQNWPLQRVSAEELGILDCEVNDPREDCLPIDPNYPGRWYHDSNPRVHRIHYRIPEGLACDHCTMQWFWATANSEPYDRASYSCYNELLLSLGWSSNFCGWACGYNACPANYTPPTDGPRAPDPAGGSGFEEFRNCADVRVVLPAATTVAELPWRATSTLEAVETTATPAHTTLPAIGPVCVPAVDCGSFAWCDVAGLTQWCFDRGQLLQGCPSPWCREGEQASSTTKVNGPVPVSHTTSSAPATNPLTAAPTSVTTDEPTDTPTDAPSDVPSQAPTAEAPTCTPTTVTTDPPPHATIPPMAAPTPSVTPTAVTEATTPPATIPRAMTPAPTPTLSPSLATLTATSTTTSTATSTATSTHTSTVTTMAPPSVVPTAAPETAPPTQRPATTVRCVANTALSRGVSDNDCARCPDGYQWWPCQGQSRGEEELCICTEVPATAGCFANPALIRSRGVSDEACARCSSGYEWWPCNEAGLCICGDPAAPSAPLFP